MRRPKALWLAVACLAAAFSVSRAGPALPTAAMRTARVVLDPGHGGIDPGAPGPAGRPEKDVNWAVARQVADRLRAAGVPVLLTRTGDRAPTEPSYTEAGDLRARAHLANRARAVVLVSIHANAEPTGRAQGPIVYYLAGSAAGRRLAAFLARALARATGLYARPRPARHLVLTLAMMPAVTVEVGFLTHPREGERLFQTEWQARLADGIAAGITDYLRASLSSSSTTANAAMPAPAPSTPSRSAVLNLTATAGVPSTWASTASMAARYGPSRGASATTVASRLPTA